jgi:hypothetical protein
MPMLRYCQVPTAAPSSLQWGTTRNLPANQTSNLMLRCSGDSNAQTSVSSSNKQQEPAGLPTYDQLTPTTPTLNAAVLRPGSCVAAADATRTLLTSCSGGHGLPYTAAQRCPTACANIKPRCVRPSQHTPQKSQLQCSCRCKRAVLLTPHLPAHVTSWSRTLAVHYLVT